MAPAEDPSLLNATLEVSVPLRLVARPPASGRSPSPVLLTRHGYGMDAETMLALSSRFVPDDFLLVSV